MRGKRKFIECGERFKVGRMVCSICNHYIMGNRVYVGALGLIGTVITAIDIVRTMHDKEVIRCQSRHGYSDTTLSIKVEREIKLMTSILGIEHYTLIMLGALTGYPMLHIPWLLMQLCVIIVEIIIFFVRLFLGGFHVTRDEVLMAILSVHNWLQVFCLFHRQFRSPLH